MDSTKITHLSLFAGFDGTGIALREIFGQEKIRTLVHCDIEAFVCANLVSKMEKGIMDEAPIWTDIRTFPWELYRGKVDILTGGFPCQPYSLAGQKRGDQDPRHLFPALANGITIVRPKVVFLENVAGLVSAKLKGDCWRDPEGTPVLLHVLRELERIGYTATWGLFTAAEVGAPHVRKRVFILAVDDSKHNGRDASEIARSIAETICLETAWPYFPVEFEGTDNSGILAEEFPDSGEDDEIEELPNDNGDRIQEQHRGIEYGQKFCSSGNCCCHGKENLGNPVCNGHDAGEISGSIGKEHGEGRLPESKGGCHLQGGCKSKELADTTDIGYERIGGQQPSGTPAPTEGCGAGLWPWPARPGESQFGYEPPRIVEKSKTQSQICGIINGNSNGMDYAELCQSYDSLVDEIRMLGNGVVPQTAAKAFVHLILDFV